MEVLAYIPYFLPCIVSLICALFLVLKKRTPQQSVFMMAEFAFTFYSLVYALYVQPNTDYKLMIRLDAWCIPVIMSMLALYTSYIHMLYTRKNFRYEYFLLFIPAMILGSVNGILYYLMGFDKAIEATMIYDATGTLPSGEIYKLYHLFAETLVDAAAIIFCIAILTQCFRLARRDGYAFGSIFRFFFRGGTLATSIITSFLTVGLIATLMPVTLMGRVFMMDHMLLGTTLAVVMAIIKLLLYHVEVASDTCRSVSLHEFINQEVQGGAMDASLSEDEDELSPHASPFIDLTHERFHHLLTVEKIYKDENLTLNTLSDKMGIGRTTISTMIKIHYGVPFRDLINSYRIETAKKHMLQHPEATQEAIAQICGFKNGNYLNTKFKEMTGETPMMWLAKNKNVCPPFEEDSSAAS